MSIQVLLPKDVIIRQLCICIANDELPIKYRSNDGLIKERNAKMLLSGPLNKPVSECLEIIQNMFKDTNTKLKAGKTDPRDINRTVLDGNFQAWQLINDLMGDKGDIVSVKSNASKSIENDLTEAIKMSFARRGNWVTKENTQRAMHDISTMMPTFAKLESIACELEEVRDRFNKEMAKANKLWKREGRQGAMEVPKIYSEDKRTKYYQIGSVCVIYYTNKAKRIRCRLMSNTHYSRVIEFIRSTASLAISMSYINGLTQSEDTLMRIIRKLISVGLMYPNAVGGIYKSARQILFLEGDKESVMGNSPKNLYINGLTGGKSKMAEEIASHLLELTGDRKSALNLGNVFKMVVHPDAEMNDVFNSIKGVQDPNVANPSNYSRFEGTARRAIYASLSAQKVDIRAEVKDPTNAVNVSFVASINSTAVPVSSILQAGFTKWAGIKFLPPRRLFDKDNQDIPVSNKSSAPEANIDTKLYNKINNPKTLSDLKGIRERLKAVNDVVTTLEGTSNLNFKEARVRFRNVMYSHKKFEKDYLQKGLTIEDIPSEDLEKFILSDTSASYSVGTEPKLGEVHKEITRMFYLGEQALKIMTQVCERFTKKVISKASGISIVKTFRARRKELESMLNAYTGMMSTEDGDVNALMISFDMSEFSKKFPNSLIRILGVILSELSGEDWMSRIDLFFRAAVVYNSTRGFTAAMGGVKGGFEGFLNFLWTLAMRVVMDIATQSTGVEGVLAVYSDDGLLRLYIGGTKEEVRKKILLIQKVFSDYGLIFHLDKTVASYEIMEYLGVYAEKGMIITTWVKELMSIGKRKQTPGLETVADKIQLWDSQTSAFVKAGGPPDIAMILDTFLSVRTLRRLNLITHSSVLCALTVIPFSAGGFRVPSISEKCLLSSIESLSEFSSDIELICDQYPAYAACICYTILGSLKSGGQCDTNLLSGSLLQTTLADTSGVGVLRSLIDSSGLDANKVNSPLTNDIKKKILADIKTSHNFSPRDLKNMIQEVPDMIEYNKAMAIMKSSAALKFVSRENMAKAQRKDTNICKGAIEFWSRELKGYDSNLIKIRSSELTARIIAISYGEYDIARLRESPRTALTPAYENADILTNFEATTDLSINEQLYIEPEAKFLGAQLTPEFSAESSANTKQRRVERFVATAARIVASNASMLYLYYCVANAFSLPCPALPAQSVVSSHRSSKNFGENAVASFLPSPFHALISARMSVKMWNDLTITDRTDRTTYIEAARIATYLNVFHTVNYMSALNGIIIPINYILRDVHANTRNPVLDMRTLPDGNLIRNDTTKSFLSTIVEQISQEKSMESSVFTSGLLSSLLDTHSVKAILLNRLQGWLFSCLNGNINSSSGRCPARIPTNWMAQLYIEATIQVSFRLCSPITRAKLNRAVSLFLRATDGLSTADSLGDNVYLNQYIGLLRGVESDVDELQRQISIVSGAVSCLDLDNDLKERLQNINVMNNSDGLYLINVLKRMSITGGSTIPTVVINSETFADTGMSKAVKNSIGECVYTLIQEYVKKATLANSGPSKSSLDLTLNYLYILKNMLRPSGHRNTPFNKHMLSIQMIKLELFIEYCLGTGVTEITTDTLANYRIPTVICNNICFQNNIIAGLNPLTSGTDMREALFNQGLPNWALPRVKYIITRLTDSYKSTFINHKSAQDSPIIVQQVMNFVMSTYNMIVRESVAKLDIRHVREADAVSDIEVMYPVQEASMVSAEVSTSSLELAEVNKKVFENCRDYRNILSMLLIAHSSRWVIEGYQSIPSINSKLIEYGIYKPDGSSLTVRSEKATTFSYVTQSSDFELTTSSYNNKDKAIHNYLAINSLTGGMAVMAFHDDVYYVIGITPAGTKSINTESTKKPNYVGSSSQDVIIYSIKTLSSNLLELCRVLGARPRTIFASGEMASIALSQAYQRQIGARGTVVEHDIDLCAISELVRGAWSVDIAYRVLAYFLAWFCTNRMVDKTSYDEAKAMVLSYNSSIDPRSRHMLDTAASAVWSWVRNCNMVAGPDIDSNEVVARTTRIGKTTIKGGTPQVIHNLIPKSVAEVMSMRRSVTMTQFLAYSASVLNVIPMNKEITLEDGALDTVDDDW